MRIGGKAVKIKKRFFVLLFSIVILAAAVLLFMRANTELTAPAEPVSYSPFDEAVSHTAEASAAIVPYFKTEDEFLREIMRLLFDGYQEITVDEWLVNYGDVLAAPGYIPARFRHYEGVFVKPDPGIPTQTMTMQLWYDPQNYELLTITQEETDSPDSAGWISTEPLSWNETSDLYPWAKYCSTCPQVKNGVSLYGYLLVNDITSQAECEKIFESIM
jgi:hypothetical protein